MIDTIVLRVHRIGRYKNILRELDQFNEKGYSTMLGKVSESEMQNLRNQGITDPSQMMEILKMNRTGKFLVRSKMAKQVSASSHYQFVYRVDYTNDFIEFNFSIPKYKYGSNVKLFVDHFEDRDFEMHFCTDLGHNISRAFDKLHLFLRGFFRREFAGVTIDPKDVEVHRIDVCFNQVFHTKEEALRFQEYQRRKVKKYTREGNPGYKDYGTTLMYVTGDYSAKIYHKGTEYAKNDSKEHAKYNKQKGKQKFNIPQYQAFADRMLRYELTIRTGMLNYLHKAHVFRRNCPYWQRDFTIYQEVEAAQQRNERIAKKIGSLPEEEKEAYRVAHPYEKITRENRQIYKYVTRVINKRTHFVFEVAEEDALYNEQIVSWDSKKATFCPELLELCLQKLVSFMQEFQIKELPSEAKVERAIDEYNLRHTKKLPKGDMLDYYHDLAKCGSFKEASIFRSDHRATRYRYMNRFKLIGITDNNLIPLTAEGIPGAPLDLSDYHSEHMYNPHFRSKNDFFDVTA